MPGLTPSAPHGWDGVKNGELIRRAEGVFPRRARRLEYNQQARLNPVPRSTRKPKGVKSDPERTADQVLEQYTRGR